MARHVARPTRARRLGIAVAALALTTGVLSALAPMAFAAEGCTNSGGNDHKTVVVTVASGSEDVVISSSGTGDLTVTNVSSCTLPTDAIIAVTVNGDAGNETVTFIPSTSLNNMTITADLKGGSDVVVVSNENELSAFGSATVDTYLAVERIDLVGSDNASEDITGGSAGEYFYPGDGDDTMYGNGGNDVFVVDDETGGSVDDTFWGGSGIDTVDYSAYNGGVTVTIGAGTKNDGGNGENDDVRNDVENVIGTDSDDSLTGYSTANVLVGGEGDDTLVGGSGNDTLVGGADDDSYKGDAGTDTVSFNDDEFDGAAASAITFSLAITNSAQVTGGAGSDTIETGGSIEILIGSSYADVLTGTAGADTLGGYSGNDTLNGGDGADLLDGGPGTDATSYAGSDEGVTVNLTTGAASGGYAAGDTLESIESVTGSSEDDSLTGTATANVLRGGSGDDELIGLAGADALYGDSGDDTASYADSASAVTVSLASGKGTGGDAQGDTLSRIENVTGSDGNDVLTGNVGPNTLDGGDGNDLLSGGYGDDRLVGGAGKDTVTYAGADAAVTVSLRSGTASGEEIGDDSLATVENVIGTSYGDTLVGGNGGNTLTGGGGSDTLTGLGGADRLVGGTGADVLSGGDGNDRLDGGGGADKIDGGSGTDTCNSGPGKDTVTECEK